MKKIPAPKPEEPKEEAAPPKPLYRLKLDHEGVYWGAELFTAGIITENDIILDHAPDNTPGRYKWNETEKRLDALPPSQVKTEPGVPSLEMAFNSLLQSLEDNGHSLPAMTVIWRDAFRNSLDNL